MPLSKRIHDIPEFLSAIEFDEVAAHVRGGTTEALFRGHGSDKYELLPSLYRMKGAAQYEREMYRDFINNSSHLIEVLPRNYIEWLFLMQHHGLPTRLLDWSESPLVALFFAVEKPSTEDAEVWILNPWELNRHSSIKRSTLPSSQSKDTRKYVIDVDDPKVPRYPKAEFPICIRTQRNSTRALNQKAMVTIHGSELISLSKYEKQMRKSFLSRIIVDGNSRSKILNNLNRLGVSHDFIYPGLDGLAQTIKYKHIDSKKVTVRSVYL